MRCRGGRVGVIAECSPLNVLRWPQMLLRRPFVSGWKFGRAAWLFGGREQREVDAECKGAVIVEQSLHIAAAAPAADVALSRRPPQARLEHAIHARMLPHQSLQRAGSFLHHIVLLVRAAARAPTPSSPSTRVLLLGAPRFASPPPSSRLARGRTPHLVHPQPVSRADRPSFPPQPSIMSFAIPSSVPHTPRAPMLAPARRTARSHRSTVPMLPPYGTPTCTP
mmetsp:Transcript_3993/g.10979  ORF Transcript_3993/g.10979 Transcript_3993/m.10979 type:complete len:223 (-) Transcript_3993:31-699(-)